MRWTSSFAFLIFFLILVNSLCKKLILSFDDFFAEKMSLMGRDLSLFNPFSIAAERSLSTSSAIFLSSLFLLAIAFLKVSTIVTLYSDMLTFYRILAWVRQRKLSKYVIMLSFDQFSCCWLWLWDDYSQRQSVICSSS